MANLSFEGVFFIWLLITNSILFVLMYRDKQLAIKRKRRISEKTLLVTSILGGGLGGFLGMLFFRHKTKQFRFYFVYLSSILFWIFLASQII